MGPLSHVIGFLAAWFLAVAVLSAIMMLALFNRPYRSQAMVDWERMRRAGKAMQQRGLGKGDPGHSVKIGADDRHKKIKQEGA